jgi:hypothetical protein
MSEQPQRMYADMWVDPEDDPRETDSVAVGEKAVLTEYLDRYRLTLRMKCEGLNAEQLAQRSVPPSSMSLLGLVRHLARVEHHWFRRALESHVELDRLYRTEEDRDLDFNGALPRRRGDGRLGILGARGRTRPGMARGGR